MIVDFSKQNSASFWRPINDGVMGGISRSQLQYDSEVVNFSQLHRPEHVKVS
jgi:hypothetical protein